MAGIPRLLLSTMVVRGVSSSLRGSFFGLFFFCFSWALPFSPRAAVSRLSSRFFEIFGIYADSRFCPRVDSSPQLRKLDGNLPIWVVRLSPPVVNWHTLDGNLPIWVVRGSPPVASWHTLDGNPSISLRSPALRALVRQEHLGSAVPLGLPYVLNYQVYASTSSMASGALR